MSAGALLASVGHLAVGLISNEEMAGRLTCSVRYRWIWKLGSQAGDLKAN